MAKRGPPFTTGIGTTIGVRVHEEFIKAVDAWRRTQEMPPTRSAAVRYLAEIGLKAKTKPKKERTT